VLDVDELAARIAALCDLVAVDKEIVVAAPSERWVLPLHW
jgi:hypothetical protein